MGRINVRGKARYKGKERRFEAIIDSGADITFLTHADACALGLDERTATPTQVSTAGDGVLKGYAMYDVEITANKRTTKLDTVFIPMRRQDAPGKLIDISKTEKALLGHDFLQRSGAVLDYGADQLKGQRLESFRPPMRFLPAAKGDRELLLRTARCAVPKRKRKR